MEDAEEGEIYRSWRVQVGDTVHWTVVNERYERHREAHDYLLHLRFAGDAAESTVRSYAGDLALFLTWAGPGGDLLASARRLTSFMAWMKLTPIPRGRRGAGRVRSLARQQRILVAVREFYRYCAAHGLVEPAVLGLLFEVSDDSFLPSHLKGEGHGLAYVARPRHRVRVPRTDRVPICDPEEFEALFAAASNWRDRFLLILIWFTGLRLGQALGLCREDLHLAASSRQLGCSWEGPHVHVVRRENSNGARSKSRRTNVIPLDEIVILAYERYHQLRGTVPGADANPLLFVNIAKNPGAGMTTGYTESLFDRLSRKAGTRPIRPHMLRHSFATTVRRNGAPLDVLQALLGHACLESTLIYDHISLADMRQAVAKVPAPTGRW